MRFIRYSIPKYSLILICLFFSTAPAFSQLTVTSNYTAAVLAGKLAGPGVTILNPVLTCPSAGNGMFTATMATNVRLDSGIMLTSGTATNAIGAASVLASSNMGAAGDATLASLARSTTYDACTLEFDLIPKGDTVQFEYQFGSEEYTQSTCGAYNDAFAFFISGPGITGTENMALVPNTNIPVLVNSINSGIPGTQSGSNIVNCTSLGPGSPFTQYFINNASGIYLKYQGITDVLKAVHQVIPCQTYHLKLSIADAGNALYDSGVFLKASSLKTNTFRFDKDDIGAVIDGVAHAIVKGCGAKVIQVLNSGKASTAQTVNLNISGTAVNGVDYQTLPTSVTIPAGDTGVFITINPLATIPVGVKTLHMELSNPFTCGITDSITINILDTPSASIITPDTTICNGIPCVIRVNGTRGLTYSWAPAGGLNNASVKEPTANPTASMIYTMTATLPNSGCTPIVRKISLKVDSAKINLLSDDTSICIGTSLPIDATGPGNFTYTWTPAKGLSNSNIINPIATPDTTTTYKITVLNPVSGCTSTEEITIAIGLPRALRVQGDTVCEGQEITFTNPYLSTASIWYFGDGAIDSGQTITHTYDAGNYEVMLIMLDTFSCHDSIVSSLLVDPTPYATFTTTDSQLCQGTNLRFAGDYQKSGNIGLEWTMGDDRNTTFEDLSVVTHSYDRPGDFTIRFSAKYRACPDTFFASVIKVKPYPLINIGEDTSVCPNASITLTDLVNGGNPAATWVWNTKQTTPSIEARNPATYFATVTIDGCSSTDSVLVVNDCYVDVPNAFSPNGDGMNDYFFPRQFLSRGITSFTMEIYNRWGQIIYSTNNTNGRGWDGKASDAVQPEGVYIYMIDATFKDGGRAHKQGNVTLLR